MWHLCQEQLQSRPHFLNRDTYRDTNGRSLRSETSCNRDIRVLSVNHEDIFSMTCKFDVYDVILYHRNMRIELNNSRSFIFKTRHLYINLIKNDTYPSAQCIERVHWKIPHPLQDSSSSSNIFSNKMWIFPLTRIRNVSDNFSSNHRLLSTCLDLVGRLPSSYRDRKFSFTEKTSLNGSVEKTETEENNRKMHWWLFPCRLSNNISRWRDHRLDNCKIKILMTKNDVAFFRAHQLFFFPRFAAWCGDVNQKHCTQVHYQATHIKKMHSCVIPPRDDRLLIALYDTDHNDWTSLFFPRW